MKHYQILYSNRSKLYCRRQSMFLFLVFILLFFILDLGKECNMMLYMMVIQVTKYDGSMMPVIGWSHNHVTQRRIIEGSGTNDIV